jgi:hypothetical protein
MFSPAAFAQAPLPADQELAEAMLASAAKRARTEGPQSYLKMDLEKLKLKTLDGKESPIYLAVVEHQLAEFVLTPDEPTVLLRGFDMAGDKEKRSFNAQGGKGNHLSIYIQLSKDQATFLQEASDQLKAQFEAEGKVEWSPLLSKNEKYDSSAVGVDVCLVGQEASLTQLRIKRGEEKHAGAGWDFLKEMAQDKYVAFKGAEAMVVTKFRPWKSVVEGVTKAGVKLVATQLAIKVAERKFVDVLPDW